MSLFSRKLEEQVILMLNHFSLLFMVFCWCLRAPIWGCCCGKYEVTLGMTNNYDNVRRKTEIHL